jgi:hypothetical protein
VPLGLALLGPVLVLGPELAAISLMDFVAASARRFEVVGRAAGAGLEVARVQASADRAADQTAVVAAVVVVAAVAAVVVVAAAVAVAVAAAAAAAVAVEEADAVAVEVAAVV